MALSDSGFHSGPWTNARHHYLGFEFLVAGELHFGWARLNVGDRTDFVGHFGATLTGYAYETVPNRPIQAGQTQSDDDMGSFVPQTLVPEGSPVLKPATLGLLAEGASGLVAWRREDEHLLSV